MTSSRPTTAHESAGNPTKPGAPRPSARTMRWTSRLAATAVLAPIGLTLTATPAPAPVVHLQPAGSSASSPFVSRSSTRDDALVAVLKQASVSAPTGSSLLDVAPGLDVPAPALRAYRFAEAVMRRADPGCHLDWSLLAAIGDVESDHGRYGGASVLPDGTSTPRILGPRLDGGDDVAAITDTDDGGLDGDRTWDRAVGPMQFIPSTWSYVGADADGDGARNPHDIDDAALAAAAYLCAGDADLGTTSGQEDAVYRYNHSASYVDLVLRLAGEYADDTFALTAPQPTVRPASPPVDVPTLERPVDVGAHPAQSPAESLGTEDVADAPATPRHISRRGDRGRPPAAAGPSPQGDGGGHGGGDGGSTAPAPGGGGRPGTGGGDAGTPTDPTVPAGNTQDPASTPTPPPDGAEPGQGNTSDPSADPDPGATNGGGAADGSDGSQDGSPDGDTATLSGTLTRSDEGAWLVAGEQVSFGDEDYLAGQALHDFDGADGVESNLAELETLLDQEVTVVLAADLVQELNGMTYR